MLVLLLTVILVAWLLSATDPSSDAARGSNIIAAAVVDVGMTFPSPLPSAPAAANVAAPQVQSTARDGAAALLFMHGLGGSGAGIARVVKVLLKSRPYLQLVTPDAPLRSTTIGRGRPPMRAWFDMEALPLTLDEPTDIGGFVNSTATIHEHLDALVRDGVPAHRIVLGGFSQGGAMTLFAGLRYKVPLAGLLVVGGWAVAEAELSSCMAPAVAAAPPPILVAHGRHDRTIPFAFAETMRDALAQRNFTVTWSPYDGGHQLPPLQLIDAFMERVLSR